MKGLALAVVLATGLVASSGCGPGARTSKAPAKHATVFIDCDVVGAEVWVDGRYVAPVAQLRNGVSLAPGEHRLEIRDDEHFAHYSKLTVAPHERRRLEVELAEILP